ncbi:MAG: type IV secretion system protein VirB10 [Janthinobacterium lividum]
MTELPQGKKTNKNTSSSFVPEISKLSRKRTVNLVPTLAILGTLLLFLGFMFYSYFKDLSLSAFFGLSEPKKTMVNPDIVKRDFSFKKHIEDEKPVEVVKSDPKPALTSQEKPRAPKPRFQKYKSIPVKSSSTETAASAPSAVQEHPENKEQSQEKSEMAVVAESSAIDPNFLIPEGTYIPCSLITKFTSDVNGRITCTISEDIYSANGAVKLIERGTKAIGTYKGGNIKHGMGRMFVIWTKLRTPDFKSIKLVDSQVVGRLGESGIDGWVDAHFFERFGGAILLSTAKDILKMTQENKKEGNDSNTTVNVSTMDETKSAFASIVEKMLENSINIPPTLYKNQGDIIGIMVGRDIDFSKVYTLEMKR